MLTDGICGYKRNIIPSFASESLKSNISELPCREGIVLTGSAVAIGVQATALYVLAM